MYMFDPEGGSIEFLGEAEAPSLVVKPSKEEVERQEGQRKLVRFIRDTILEVHDLLEDIILAEPEKDDSLAVALGEMDELDTLLKEAAVLATELAVDY